MSTPCSKQCPSCTALLSPGCSSLLLWNSNNWLPVCIIKQGMTDTERCRSFSCWLALCPSLLFLTRTQRSSKQYRVWYYWYYSVFVCIQTHTQAVLCMWSVFQGFALPCLTKEWSGCHCCCVHSELYPGLWHKQHL